ncbi:MAG: phosphoribosylaminoimidazolesuccinocarboxamide synthase [Spirochaetota bacterium]
MNPTYVGKVRDVYEHGNALILCSTDRISAFDVVFDESITDKGIVLNQISNMWFHFFQQVPNHIIETTLENFPLPFRDNSYFKDRSVLVKKCKRIDYECVVRGYLSGSAYKEYRQTGKIASLSYPLGIRESEKLAEPIFTPAIKNDSGHDQNISESQMQEEVGDEIFQKLKKTSLYLYETAAAILEQEDLILCDTKFEFGFYEGEIILIDELLTPDSSRYWDKSTYETGISPPSYDKQILRNYLETLSWDKSPPAPKLPQDIIQKMQNKYKDLEKRIHKCLLEKSV